MASSPWPRVSLLIRQRYIPFKRVFEEGADMRRILVALDDSPEAAGVLDAAARLARQMDSRLVLLRVVGLAATLPADAYLVPPVQLEGSLVEHARESLHALAGRVAGSLVESTRVEIGSPWDVICHLAKREDVALIVMGSHSHGILGRLLGTTASHVVNHADRSVLVVRAPELLQARRNLRLANQPDGDTTDQP